MADIMSRRKSSLGDKTEGHDVTIFYKQSLRLILGKHERDSVLLKTIIIRNPSENLFFKPRKLTETQAASKGGDNCDRVTIL